MFQGNVDPILSQPESLNLFNIDQINQVIEDSRQDLRKHCSYTDEVIREHVMRLEAIYMEKRQSTLHVAEA